MAEEEKKSKANRVETEVYINGERYIQVTVTDYYDNIVFSSLYNQ